MSMSEHLESAKGTGKLHGVWRSVRFDPIEGLVECCTDSWQPKSVGDRRYRRLVTVVFWISFEAFHPLAIIEDDMSKDCLNGFKASYLAPQKWMQILCLASVAKKCHLVAWKKVIASTSRNLCSFECGWWVFSVSSCVTWPKNNFDPFWWFLMYWIIERYWKISESPSMKCQCVDSRYPRMWGQGKLQTSPTSSCQGSWNGKASYYLDRLGELRGGSFPKLLN